jgi:serine/threonine-protein kinase
MLVGDTVATAKSRLASEHLKLNVGPPVFSITVIPGHVVSQTPSPKVMLKEGGTVKVVVSKGPPPVPVPSLSGVDCLAAQKMLSVAHLVGVCAPAAAAYSQSVPAGQVINWSYDNILNATSAPYGATIQIAISKGKPPVTIPTGLVGGSFQAAKAALSNLGLAVSQASQYSTSVPAGEVISTNPAPGQQAPAGSTVTVVVSAGPPMVTVPALGGDTVAQATAALQALGLTVANVYGPPKGTVFDSVPASGATVVVGSSVNLYTK